MKTLLVEAQMKKSPSRHKDGCVGISFETMREISTEEFSLMDQYFLQKGWLAFKIDEMEVDDIPEANTQIKGQKSPSQLLRNHIFALHMKKGGTKENFPPYYERYMARIERAVQDEIDKLED